MKIDWKDNDTCEEKMQDTRILSIIFSPFPSLRTLIRLQDRLLLTHRSTVTQCPQWSCWWEIKHTETRGRGCAQMDPNDWQMQNTRLNMYDEGSHSTHGLSLNSSSALNRKKKKSQTESESNAGQDRKYGNRWENQGQGRKAEREEWIEIGVSEGWCIEERVMRVSRLLSGLQ